MSCPEVPAVSLVLLALFFSSCAGEREDVHDESREAKSGAVEARHQEGWVALGPEKLLAAGLEIGQAEERQLAPQIETTGEVGYQEDRLAHVSPRIPGRVVEVPASLGDDVRKGEVLALLDSVELGQAKAAYLAALAREEVTREAYEREQTLYEDRISSQKEMLEARTDHLVARAEQRQAQETLCLYGLDPGELQSLSTGNQAASLLPLAAPISGTVVEKHATLGELATEAESLFTIADLDQVWVWIDVFERQLGGVHLGDDVEVRVEPFPGHVFTGEVTYLASQVRPDPRTVRARIEVRNTDRHLRPGMFATVRLVDPHVIGVPSTVVVPATALQLLAGEPLVFVPAGEGRFESRGVQLGRRESGWVEVLSGLDAGEEIVTQGAFILKSELAREELGGGHDH